MEIDTDREFGFASAGSKEGDTRRESRVIEVSFLSWAML